MAKRSDLHRLVYSSEQGRVHSNDYSKKQNPAPTDGFVRLRRETKGRGGKTVVTISGVPLDENGLRQLAADLKRACGTGGAIKNGIIEIQGDHRERLVAELEKRAYKVKLAGG